MKITREMNKIDYVFELTGSEMESAYYEQDKIFKMNDCESRLEDMVNNGDITQEVATAILDQVHTYYYKFQSNDDSWNYNLTEACNMALSEYKKTKETENS